MLAALLGVAFGWSRKAKRRHAAAAPVASAAGRLAIATEDAGADTGFDWMLALVADTHDGAPTGKADDSGDDAAVVVSIERRLARFASEPQQLPRRPQLLPQLLGTLKDDDASARELAGLVARDPARPPACCGWPTAVSTASVPSRSKAWSGRWRWWAPVACGSWSRWRCCNR